MLDGEPATVVDNRFYAPTGDAAPALHEFSGVLTTSPVSLQGSTFGEMPGFSVRFYTVDGALVPADRGIISSPGLLVPELILSPGRTWSEPGDGGLSRASFPFTLTAKTYNGAHNGVATFVYDAERVSAVYFQVTQETDEPNRIDLWGRADAGYAPGEYADLPARRAAWRQELQARIPSRPWDELEAALGTGALAPFFRDLDAADISGGGIVADGVLYYLPARTRHGDYPYPLEMRHGSFSLTKSMLAASALARLAEKYSPAVFDLRIADYVTVTASHNGWDEVTFGDLLSMTTGIGDNAPSPGDSETFADENDQSSLKWQAFFASPGAAGKLAAAFAYDDYPWGPGQIVRYNSTQYFVLAVALDNLIRSVEGPGASLLGLLQDEVLAPLGLQDVPLLTTYENDGTPGIPVLAFGLYLTVGETARILELLQAEGRWAGEQILHRDSLRRMLRRAPAADFPTSITARLEGETAPVRYLHAYYAFDLPLGGGCSVRVPYMEGFGGNNVVLLPNGVSAFRYADSGVFDPGALAVVASRVRPGC